MFEGDKRSKALVITDVKTLLFLLSEFIWIKSDDVAAFEATFMGPGSILKKILNA